MFEIGPGLFLRLLPKSRIWFEMLDAEGNLIHHNIKYNAKAQDWTLIKFNGVSIGITLGSIEAYRNAFKYDFEHKEGFKDYYEKGLEQLDQFKEHLTILQKFKPIKNGKVLQAL